MKHAFIFHGTWGYPEENWFPWMKQQLTDLNYEVIVPQFPATGGHHPDQWFDIMSKYRTLINQDSILIGHSLGGAFLLRFLESLKGPINIAAIVAAPIGVQPIQNYEMDKPFLADGFDWEKIKKSVKKFIAFYSNNDPFVPLGNGELLARELRLKLNTIKDAGHFNEAAGYLEFPALFSEILRQAQNDK